MSMSNILKFPIINKNVLRSISSATKVKPKIDLFYDVMSPFSWFAFEVLHRYKIEWNMELKLEPVSLGGIFKQSKSTSPVVLATPAKKLYLLNDIAGCAEYYGLDLILCKDTDELMSHGSLGPMRCVTTFKMFYPDYLENISRAFWMKRWHFQQDFTTNEAIMEAILQATKGSKNDLASEIAMKMQSVDVKQELKNNSEMAVEKYGIFGVPSMVVHNDDGTNALYFGADRIPMMASKLGLKWNGPNPKLSGSKL